MTRRIAHFEAILPMLRDKRYIQVDGKPLLMVYRPFDLPDGKAWTARWRKMAKDAGFEGLYLLGHVAYQWQVDEVMEMGFDAVNLVPLGDTKRNKCLALRHLPTLIRHLRGKSPLVYDYAKAIKVFAEPAMQREEVVPTILPGWDHSPRSRMRAFVMDHSTPEAFKAHVEAIKQIVDKKQNQLVMLKSWNEWGEGNYMEPDARWGKQYIDAMGSVLKQ